VFLDNNIDSSFSDLTDLSDFNDSLETDEFSSTLDYLEDSNFSDDSILATKNVQHDCTPIQKQKVHSPSSSLSNSLLYSMGSTENTPNEASIESTTNGINQNMENLSNMHTSIVLETTADYTDENKLNVKSTTVDVIDTAFTFPCTESDTNNENSIKSEIKPCSFVEQKSKIDVSTNESFVKNVMKKHISCLRKLTNFSNAQNETKKVLESSKICPTSSVEIKKVITTYNDTELWWTDDEN